MVVLDEIQRAAIGVPLSPVAGLVSGVQVGGQSHWPVRISLSWSTARSNARSVSRVSMSPMCPDM
jgi:hypothetical protein